MPMLLEMKLFKFRHALHEVFSQLITKRIWITESILPEFKRQKAAFGIVHPVNANADISDPVEVQQLPVPMLQYHIRIIP